MGCKTVNSWTLAGLVLAFFDLGIAYFLLCISAFVFFPSKFLSLVEFYLPCPCSGFFGYQNSNLCLNKLLFEWPVRKIYSVMELVKSRCPFDLVSIEDRSCSVIVEGGRGSKCANGVVEFDGEGCSSSFSSPRLQSSFDKDSGFDAKGKKIVNHKHKSGIRRRRKAYFGYGREASILPSNITRSVGVGMLQPAYSGSEMRSCLDPISGVEDGLLGDGNAQHDIDLRHNFEMKGLDYSKSTIEDLSSLEKFYCNAENSIHNICNDTNTIKILEQALVQEKATRVALYQELEKERAAAASAADEALAMILRLQEDKASIEMQARQYQRMIDEKFAYDEEEMDILKEILVRRETEIHFLEKEVEAYREIDFSGNERLEGDPSYTINGGGKDHSINPDEDLLLISQQIQNDKSTVEKEAPKIGNWLLNYEQERAPVFRKEETSKPGELADVSTLTKNNLEENEKTPKDIGMILSQTFGEELEKDGECLNQFDTESTVYDVHVIDDKTIIWKEDGGKESRVLSNATSESDSPSTSMAGSQLDVRGSSLDMISRLPSSGKAQCKTLSFDLPRNSYDEKLKIDTDVEWLREKLRIVQEEKEKLALPAEHREMETARLELVEEMVKQLRDIQQLREPIRHASLPPFSSKVSAKKRRCQSVSSEAFESS